MDIPGILIIPESMVNLLRTFSLVLGMVMGISIFLIADIIYKWNPDQLRSRIFLRYDAVRRYVYWIGIWAILVSTITAVWILTRDLQGYYLLSLIGFQFSVIFASIYVYLLFKKKIF